MNLKPLSPNDALVIDFGSPDEVAERLYHRSAQLNYVLYSLALALNPPRAQYNLDPDKLLADVLQLLTSKREDTWSYETPSHMTRST